MESAFSVEIESYFMRYEYTPQFCNSTSNVRQIYTHSELFLLDICGLRLLLWLKQDVIVSK